MDLPWEGFQSWNGLYLGYSHRSCRLGAGQAACTHSEEVGAGLDWPEGTEEHLPASSTRSLLGSCSHP